MLIDHTRMPNDAPDGSLYHWEDIADQEDWQVLLLGNGLSINVWDRFAYGQLFDGARDHLSATDLRLFAGRTNFERVLAELSTAIRVCEIAGLDATKLYNRYRSIQVALGHAIRQVHPIWSQVPKDPTLLTIRDVMEEFELIFTTSYDLLVYWAMGCTRRFAPFRDHFQYGSRHEFDPERVRDNERDIPVYYLHGALHLVVSGTGVTWKQTLTWSHTVLQQFGQPIRDDPQARPLLVTEGSAREKLITIESNAYLRHAFDALRTCEDPIVLFGSRLGQQDGHLVGAMSENPHRPVAISMRKRAKRELLHEQSRIWRRLKAERVYFYDAATHPLGSSALAVSGP